MVGTVLLLQTQLLRPTDFKYFSSTGTPTCVFAIRRPLITASWRDGRHFNRKAPSTAEVACFKTIPGIAMLTFKDGINMNMKNETNENLFSSSASSMQTMLGSACEKVFSDMNPDERSQPESRTDQSEATERSAADLAAEFANRFLMHRHRGVINCDSYFILFGNDGYSTDQRSRKECSEVWNRFRDHEAQVGLSSDGCTWSVVLTDHSRTRFNEVELDRFIWDTWMGVCDESGPN
jgi:hypothetical protein